MESMPTNEYVEVRNGAYYVAGTRIGLDVLVNDFRNGSTAEAIFSAYPAIGWLDARSTGMSTSGQTKRTTNIYGMVPCALGQQVAALKRNHPTGPLKRVVASL